jgi:hypothetical protein
MADVVFPQKLFEPAKALILAIQAIHLETT